MKKFHAQENAWLAASEPAAYVPVSEAASSAKGSAPPSSAADADGNSLRWASYSRRREGSESV